MREPLRDKGRLEHIYYSKLKRQVERYLKET